MLFQEEEPTEVVKASCFGLRKEEVGQLRVK